MLLELNIKNFAIIESLHLEFQKGLNVITGETGTGKSIILDAISLILGSRADTSLIRLGHEEATVEALFDISKSGAITKKLSDNGFIEESQESASELLIKRIIQKNGKSRIYINGMLSTLTQLVDISENLVDLCSQHEHQSLTKSPYQLDLLDRYGGLLNLKKKVQETYDLISSKSAELTEITSGNQDTRRLEDFLNFQISEIETFGPKEDEEELLQKERKSLSSVTQLLEVCDQASQALTESSEELHVKELILKAQKKISKWIDTDTVFSSANEHLEKALVEIEEASFTLTNYAQKLSLDPERLNFLEERLSQWVQMKRKYGQTTADILQTCERLSKELEELTGRKEKVAILVEEILELKKSYLASALSLSKKRKSVKKTLESSIQTELNELKMPGTEFSVKFSDLSASEETWGRDGIDSIEFHFAPNVGEGLKPLSKVASGGELSRVMLAIRRVISDLGGICVYLFDEIDSGIGGQTAAIVGKKIKSVSKDNQVICITHLAQIAAFAGSHYNVSKAQEKGRTTSHINKLSEKERIDELARMIGGIQITEKSRAHARELVSLAK